LVDVLCREIPRWISMPPYSAFMPPVQRHIPIHLAPADYESCTVQFKRLKARNDRLWAGLLQHEEALGINLSRRAPSFAIYM
jgi:hypothetical protein